MSEGFISRGFRGRRQQSDLSGRIPPGQYLERGFPVLSAGPTPHTPLASWNFSIVGEVDQYFCATLNTKPQARIGPVKHRRLLPSGYVDTVRDLQAAVGDHHARIGDVGAVGSNVVASGWAILSRQRTGG